MSLKPVLKLKVDELFLKWLTDPDVQEELRYCLSQIIKGEPVAYATPQASWASKQQTSNAGKVRAGSPTTAPALSPPPGAKVTSSPRSPRGSKNVYKKKDDRGQNGSTPGNTSTSSSLATLTPTLSNVSSTAKALQREGKEKPAVVGVSSQGTTRKASEDIPKFWFPNGRPATAVASSSGRELDAGAATLRNIADVFAAADGAKMYKHQMHALAKACGLPVYWGTLLFYACSGEKVGFVVQPTFVALWKRLSSTCFDEASKFLCLLARPGCGYLAAEDFVPLVQDIVDTHPGLQFLQDAPEFHSRYIHTVISRIFYCVNCSWSGKITIPELRRSNFLQTLAVLEEEEDINQVTDYFSYEHFYVIYCKFWELDKDHDLFISREDLSRHNDHAISLKVIERIFSGAVTRGKHLEDGKMSYTEFVWFLLSEEDKRQPRSIEYWFRCMDIDGDGVISMFEMEYFYDEQVQKMEEMGIEPLPFGDLVCQVLDMIGPHTPNVVTLADLKNCKLAHVVLNTFINLEKYLDQEQKDPFASNTRDVDGDGAGAGMPSDWEKYAAEEYEVLVAEDGNNNDDDAAYEYDDDDFEPDDEDEGNGEDGRERVESLVRPATPDAALVRGVRPRSAKGAGGGAADPGSSTEGTAATTVSGQFDALSESFG